jgi:hypothetical protein
MKSSANFSIRYFPFFIRLPAIGPWLIAAALCFLTGFTLFAADTVTTNQLALGVVFSTINGGPYSVIANLTSTAYTNTALANGTTYYYVVSALNNGLESTNSVQAFATPQCTVPAAPASLSARVGNGRITLTSDAAPGATNYVVYRSSGEFRKTSN